MPRKRNELVELESFIKENSDKVTKAKIKEIFDEWDALEDKSVGVIDFYKSNYRKAKQESVLSPKNEEKKSDSAIKINKEDVWKKYLEENPDFLALNKQMAKRYGLIESEQISKAKERQILSELKDDNLKIILLQFFKDLAHLVGFSSIKYSQIGGCNEEYAGLCCEIHWADGQVTSGIGDAHKHNTNSFAKYYLAPIAENRSFVRAVKAYFNIPILGKDEIGDIPEEEPKEKQAAPIGPHIVLQKSWSQFFEGMKDKIGSNSFAGFKAYLGSQVKKDAESAWIQPNEYDDWKGYNDWSDIKKTKVLELITKLKNGNS